MRIRDWSSDVCSSDLTRFHLQRNSLSDVLEDLSDRLTIAEQGKQSGVIGIDFQDYSAERPAAVIRHIEDGYLRQNVERRSAEAQQSLEFLQQQRSEERSCRERVGRSV